MAERGPSGQKNPQPTGPPTQVTSSRPRETISVFRSLPSPVPCEVILFNNAGAAPPVSTQQLPCNSVPQCQVMQPQILFLSISQYIHNSSSGRYNGFRETLDRGNPIMCLPEPNLNHGCRQLNWLVSAEACRNLTKLSAGSETIIIAERSGVSVSS